MTYFCLDSFSMKKIALLLHLLFLAAFIFVLNTPISTFPPLGKLLDPFHGCWQNAENVHHQKEVKMHLKGLHQAVQVAYDDRMVPHIYAQDEHDLYMAQGYVTAELRLWQMELQTHAAAGRLTEIMGPKLLEYDRFNRRNGMKYGAENLIKSLDKDPKSKALLDAYTDGINQYVDQLSPRNFPLEYKLIDYKPEHWSDLKTALLLKQMAYNLTALENDIEYSNALKIYGKEKCDLLYHDYWPEQDPIIPKGTEFSMTNSSQASNETSTGLAAFADIYKEAKPDILNGSNNWAVSGSRTKSGKPILANDPHLKLSLPSIWMEIQLTTPQYSCYGVSLPGSPAIIIGFNQHVAWGVTNAGRDIRDWYSIKFKDDSRKEYWYENAWHPTKISIEEFKIKGQKSYYDTLVFTHHGPVVYDGHFRAKKGSDMLALRWIAHDASDEFTTFHDLNAAQNVNDYFNAIRPYSCPAQNFVFACTDGTIAIQEQGKFPVQRKDQGKYVQDGSLKQNDMQSYIPFADNPHIVNPERGFVSSANQHPTDESYPYFYTGRFEYYRNRRINQLLSALSKAEIKDIEKVQLDDYNLIAASTLPSMLQHLNMSNLNSNEKEEVASMKKWNFHNNADLKQPAFFEAWLDTLDNLLWDEFTDPHANLEKPEIMSTVHFITDSMPADFYDIVSTTKKESLDDLVLLSFKAAIQVNAKHPTWSDYKHTKVEHLSRIPELSRLNVHSSGNKHIVNATTPTHGPSWRMIVDLSGDITAEGVYPGGQSGNPGSKYYDNGVDPWSVGKYFPLLHPTNANGLGQHLLYTLQLEP
jgi:penicillin amidase